MIRSACLTAFVMIGFAMPALAKEQQPTATDGNAASVEAFLAQLTWRANQQQMRQLLAHQGYIVTSDLNRTDSGHWVGTAVKDGRVVRVALRMPTRELAEPITN
jgi:hypothetical protein